nr:hypothetical protein [Tanacetum cinerariifolium]
METCATLSKKVAGLKHDKHTKSLKILKLKKRVKKLKRKKRSKHSGFKRLRKIGTSQRVESLNDTVVDVNAASKGVNVAEATVFDDEEVTMTMAQTLIKMKAEKSKLFDEQIAQRLHDKEVKKAAARDKQEKDDLERAQKYRSLKKKPVSIALARKNMIIYLKNMAGYKIEHFRELHSHESDDSMPKSPENDRYKTGEGYHVVPPPYTRTFMPPKPILVFNNAPNASQTVANVVTVESSTNKLIKDMSKILRTDAPIIEDWICDSEDKTKIESVKPT